MEREWRPQYKEVEGPFKTLVVLGDTGGGKTEWTMALCKDSAEDEEEPFMHVDCANTTSPNLHGWSYFGFRGMCLDEASPELMLHEKRLFQAGIYECLMSQSACNQFAYKVYNWRKMMVICTNKWDLSHLAPADRKWIEGNTVLLDLTDGKNNPQMWVDDAAPQETIHEGVEPAFYQEVSPEMAERLEQELRFNFYVERALDEQEQYYEL